MCIWNYLIAAMKEKRLGGFLTGRPFFSPGSRSSSLSRSVGDGSGVTFNDVCYGNATVEASSSASLTRVTSSRNGRSLSL